MSFVCRHRLIGADSLELRISEYRRIIRLIGIIVEFDSSGWTHSKTFRIIYPDILFRFGNLRRHFREDDPFGIRPFRDDPTVINENLTELDMCTLFNSQCGSIDNDDRLENISLHMIPAPNGIMAHHFVVVVVRPLFTVIIRMHADHTERPYRDSGKAEEKYLENKSADTTLPNHIRFEYNQCTSIIQRSSIL